MEPRRSLGAVLLCAILGSANSCAQVLGIDEAHGLSTGGAGSAGEAEAQLPNGSTSQSTSAGQGGSPPSEALAGSSALDLAGAGAGVSGAAAGAGGQADASPQPSLCERYCDAITTGCTGEHAQYIDRDACLAACADYPQGTPDDKTGNSVSCRLTYASKASSEPYTYCTWAGPGGDGKCGNNCEGFCSLMLHTCSAASTQSGDYFDSAADCLAACQQIKDIGNYSATNASLQRGADHVQCRLYHVGAAIAEDDPITHCHHAMGLQLCVDSTTQ